MGHRRASTPFSSIGSTTVLMAAIVASAIAFFPSFGGEFVSDDLNAIVNNEFVRGPNASVGEIFQNFSWWGATRGDAPGYRPLTTLTFALNHAMSGMNVANYHVTNILIHATNCALLFYFLGLVGAGAVVATAAAAAFCLLPIHTEAVAWIVGRAELLAATGVLLCLIGLARYRAKGSTANLGFAAIGLLIGLCSKENAVTMLAAPIVIAYFLGRNCSGTPKESAWRTAALGSVVLVATVGAYLLLRNSAGSLAVSSPGDLLDNPLSAVSRGSRLLGALALLGRYTVLTLWPAHLATDYSYNALAIEPGYQGDIYTVIGALAVVVMLGLAGFSFRRSGSENGNQRPALVCFCVVMFAATYSIVSNSIYLIGTIMGERLFYTPSIWLCVIAACGFERAYKAKATWAIGGATLVILAWTVADIHASAAWKTPMSLFERATRNQPKSARAHVELGGAYGSAGRYDDARQQFERALEIKPDYAVAWYNYGNLDARNGNMHGAIASYEKALVTKPNFIQPRYNMALAKRQIGDLPGALEALKRVVSIAPADPSAAQSLGDVALALGENAEAKAAYTRALELHHPNRVSLLINRGVATQRLGGCEPALDDYRAALALAPNHPNAVSNVVSCLQQLGRHAEAAELFRSRGNAR